MNKNDLKSKFERAPSILSSTAGEETVLLDPGQGLYFGLDAVGTMIWSSLEKTASVESLIAEVTAAFEVGPEECREDLCALLNELTDKGLVVQCSS